MPMVVFAGLALVGSARPSARTSFEQGDRAFAAGDYRSALERYTQAVEQNASFLKAHLALGATYARLGEWARSRHAFEAARALDPQDLAAMLGSARASIALGELPRAQEILRLAKKVDPGADRVTLLEAELALAAGRPAIAGRHYRRILRANPGHAAALRGAALAASREGDFEQAARFVRRAQLVDPVNPDVHRIHGLVQLQEALALPPGTRREAALEAAHESLRTALQLRPEDSELEYRLLWLELQQGDSRAALDRARTLIAGSTDSRSHQYVPAFVLLSGENADREQAKQAILRLLEATPEDSLVRFRLEELVLDNKRLHSPQSALRAMLGRYHRARFAHYDERQLADRRDFHLERTLELGSSDTDLLRRKLEFARMRGDFRVFVELLEQLVRQEPGNVSLRYRLDNALRKRTMDLEHSATSDIGAMGREAASVFVFDLKAETGMPYHPDGGQMLGRALERHLQDRGRVRALARSMKLRAQQEAGLTHSVSGTGEGLTFAPSRMTRLVTTSGTNSPAAFFVGGTYTSNANEIRAKYEVYDGASGRKIVSFRLDGTGRDAIHELSARAARRIAGLAAARATVKGFRNEGLLLNGGSRDGLEVGARLLVYRADVAEPPPIEGEMQSKLLRQLKTPLYCTVKRVAQRVALCSTDGSTEARFHRGDRAVLMPAQAAAATP